LSKAEKTREFVIERAAPVFNKKGYAGTSLTDLVNATGLTKGSIYGNFESKDEIAMAVFRYNIASLNKDMKDFLASKKTAYEKLIGLTDYYRSNWKVVFEDGGCPIQNASVEADDNLNFLKKTVQDSIKAWVGGISRTIVYGQRKGEFKINIDANEYAYAIITQLEGGIMLAKIMNKHKILLDALDRINNLINTEIRK
jgi:TetR/AcrR family transcriptional regulator, transcriptional repressor for nem operon